MRATTNKITPAFFIILVFLFTLSCTDKSESGYKNSLFERMPSDSTGIFFANTVKDSRELNIFNFRNFYNGAGVAIGDINNDGRADIFFTANQGSNKLYVNKGDFRFEDITKTSGIADDDKWHTGVSMVDVNGDGWLDIYVCNSGKLGMNKPNDLYINQRNGTFKEEAERYGLADRGLSTQAAFFDYDNDGDLDCFVLNNSPRSIESFGYNKSIRSKRDTLNGDRFYRNDNGHYTDVSEQAGIYGSEIGFGLGITVGDLNNDGWQDMYVSNDFFERDYLYINNKQGGFSEVINDAIGHISQGSMGSDIADINNDGYLDIFTTEMLPESDYKLKTTIKFDEYDVQNARLQNDFHHQFTSNCLQLNNGDGTFSEIAQLAGVDATGWSWGALSFDFDNDGWRDIFVSNGLNKDLTDQDFLEFFGSEEVLNKVRKGGFDFQDILEKMPSNKVPNYAFVNQRNLRFKNMASDFGLAEPSFSNGAAYGDLDNDGDLDLVVNNENMDAFVYRNRASEQLGNHYLKIKLEGNSPNVQGIGTRVTVYAGQDRQIVEQVPCRGFQSSVDHILHIGLGKAVSADSIVIQWPGGLERKLTVVPADTMIICREDASSERRIGEQAKPALLFTDVTDSRSVPVRHVENQFIDFDAERLIPKMLSTEGPVIALADINNDGMQDLFVGNAMGDTARILVQNKDGYLREIKQTGFDKDNLYETTGAVFFDVDNDGDNDLFLASGGNQAHERSAYYKLRIYLNDGKGSFVTDTRFNLPLTINASCVSLIDIDNDKLLDVFIGARSIPGRYGMAPSSALLHNNGDGTFEDVTATLAPELQNFGMVTDARVADINKDGSSELIVAGDWLPITIFSIQEGGLRKTGKILNSEGWWNCMEIDDIDDDGDIDIIGGNAGLNSRIKASEQQPAKLYVGDIDQNGQTECVPVYFKSDGRAYPYFMKGELQQQVPSLKKDFLYFADYAGKGIEEIFTKEELNNMKVLEAKEFRSCLFRNNGKGEFQVEALPLRAQFSYVYAINVGDYNKDGKKDLFLGGNFFGLKPQGGRFDACYGTCLVADQGGYRYLKPAESGLFVKGEVRDIKQLTSGREKYLLVAMNNACLKIFKQNFN